ncbi:MAG: Asp-tRNA(Asn)/Glu-tRNA(Gln) amidotransferase subunit GatA [Bacteroidia bacterium]|nr:Asp-tRNA(Asn)/Glu-tRNA(Gln) amidotransferase subunit GatA [Bacteroidia bacterium]
MNAYQTLAEIQRDLAEGACTVPSLVESYVQTAAARASLNAWLEWDEAAALEQAAGVQARIGRGTAGPLAGLVLGIKDVICYRGRRLSAASRILEGFESQITATAVERLAAADAVILGRLNCDEFAMGSSNENSAFGAVRNPLDESRVPGGSSGGSAAAVAARTCHAALGSDTGGSVRQPAAFCGLVGLKPTYGRISRWGLIAYGSSFDQIGTLTHSVEDAARLLHVMAGPDGRDTTASPEPVPDYPAQMQAFADRPLRIGYVQETLDSPGLDPEIRAQMQALMGRLQAAGHTLREVHFPLMPYVVPCYYILTTAEASSNLARYDGIRYGHRAQDAASIDALYRRSRTEGFGAEVQRRILLGSFVLSSGYYDAYYRQAMKVRRLIRTHTLELLQDCDVLLTPTAPGTAFRLGEKSGDPIAMYLSDIYTVHANLAGIPAISLPLGLHSDGLPTAVQLMGRPFEEGLLLGSARKIEQTLKNSLM